MPDETKGCNPGHHDVFISYAQEDKTVADMVCARLESHNIRCWIAPRDISPGKNFPEAIIEGIEDGKVVVLIFSSFANKSPHVTRELTNAVNKGRIIIPFRIEDVRPSKTMEYLIGVPHWLDAVTPPLENHIATLITTIERIIGTDKTPSADPAAATTEIVQKPVIAPPPPFTLQDPEPPCPEVPKPEEIHADIPQGPATPPFQIPMNMIIAGIILVALIVGIFGFSAGLFTVPAGDAPASGETNTTGTIPPGISEADYYRSSDARVNTVVLTVIPTQTMAKDTELYIDVSKDSSKAMVTVQFDGGPGMGLIRDNRVILTRSDGTAAEGKLNFNQRLSSVQLQGSRGTDRLQVIVILHSGEERSIVDTLLPYRQYR